MGPGGTGGAGGGKREAGRGKSTAGCRKQLTRAARSAHGPSRRAERRGAERLFPLAEGRARLLGVSGFSAAGDDLVDENRRGLEASGAHALERGDGVLPLPALEERGDLLGELAELFGGRAGALLGRLLVGMAVGLAHAAAVDARRRGAGGGGGLLRGALLRLGHRGARGRRGLGGEEAAPLLSALMSSRGGCETTAGAREHAQ